MLSGWSIGFMIFWLIIGYFQINSFLNEASKYIISREALALLVFHYYTRLKPPITALGRTDTHIITTTPQTLWASVSAWIIGLSITTTTLIKKQRGVGAEEILVSF